MAIRLHKMKGVLGKKMGIDVELYITTSWARSGACSMPNKYTHDIYINSEQATDEDTVIDLVAKCISELSQSSQKQTSLDLDFAVYVKNLIHEYIDKI